ncbi:NAD(+)--dinitrogen-reductase ADP-D-ribosyltransferase [Consotaella salsifontis]|uniref:NAD+---dinitrogen-reductase ADP-D-ribosyltransferase n=1 Tax=Consotaella salsifontis TaxID=1365950 RepID=A0A1T4S944_9HYPH|nr:NAD(+)--dinitrogen-reductase ADP-D-ribosyltransferase [Consotaella salsifontis]SKA24735.1 NAD+---dinitrogen-reductase ADP-D-ribosyltransferase [Consotaella salsifontis]
MSGETAKPLGASGGGATPSPPNVHGTNLVGVSPALIASAAFNDRPLRLRIAGVLDFNPSLFEMLAEAASAQEAAEAFDCYMAAMFGLDPEQWDHRRAEEPRRFRSSYLRLLKGWGYDSNGPEGAVLKGWVESRFGLYPTFHKRPLGRFNSPAWTDYVIEKMSSRFHNNSIQTQLDLLYEYCQWCLPAWHCGAARHLTLFRGINDYAEHHLVERIDRRTAVLRLNNLASFTGERDVAGCFGDIILEVHVPVAKILFFNELLTRHPLKGEGEYLVVGSDYRATTSYF